jgi:hypothetical protein
MDPNTILQIVNSIMSIADKILDKLPTYLQKKKEKIFKLTQEVFEENQKPYGTGPYCKDEILLDHKVYELQALLKIFGEELGIETKEFLTRNDNRIIN